MAKAIIDEQNLTDIADAIRAKNGSADTYTPSEMATAIGNLPTPTPVTKGLVFSDYDADGYPTKAEIVGMTEIPNLFFTAEGTNAPTFCSKITTVTLHSGLERIGSNVFRNKYLTSLILPNGVTYIGNSCFSGTQISELIIPSSYTAVTVDTFGYARYLQNIVFEGDITAVARYGFEYAGQTAGSLTIDFSHCTGVPTLENSNAFSNTPAKIFKVPNALLAEWQTTGNWASVTNVTWQGV